MVRTTLAAVLAAVLLGGCGIAVPSELAVEQPTEQSSSAEAAPDASPAQAQAEEHGSEAAADEAADDADVAASGSDAAAVPVSDDADEVDPELGPLYDVLSVYDGDTIAVSIDGQRERVRIIGINAPELARGGNAAECYAQESASQMQSLVQSQRVHLLPDPTQDDRDRYDRLLRHVVRESGGHVAYLMVSEGFAVERQYAAPYAYQSDLLAAQEQARSQGLGLWSACGGLPDGAVPVAPVAPAPAAPAPSAPAEPAPAEPAPSECVIKGNIASDGERIYHVPGQRYYDDTVVSPDKGERWFCTEQEAQDAGWRKAKV